MVTQITREDGRDVSQVRQIAVEYSVLQRADGSCRFKQGDTVVLASVFGPIETRQPQNELIDRAFLSVVVNPETGSSTQREKDMERVLRGVFESAVMTKMFPRLGLSVVVQVVSDDGGLLGCMINAITVALMDAGVPMAGVPMSVACVVSRVSGDDKLCIFVDSTQSEEDNSSSLATLCFSDASEDIVASVTEGVFTREQFKQTVTVACTGAALVRTFVEKTFKAHLNANIQLGETNKQQSQLLGAQEKAADKRKQHANEDSSDDDDDSNPGGQDAGGMDYE